MTQVTPTQSKDRAPADGITPTEPSQPKTLPERTPERGYGSLVLPQMLVFLQTPKEPEKDAKPVEKAKELKAFVTAIGEIEKKVDKVLADDSDPNVTTQERLDKAAKLLRVEALAAAKKSGIGEFKDVNELHDHLLKNHNTLYVPSFAMTSKGPRINIEVARVTPFTVEEAEVEKLLAGFTKVTGIKLTGKQTAYKLEEMLHDSDPKTGISANYGSSGGIPGSKPFVVIHSKLIQDEKKSYLTDPKEKEKTVLANELVTTAYTNKYPKLMADPLKAFATYGGVRIGPIHVAELASDYASLTAGEHVVDVAKRMSIDTNTYALSNIVVGKSLVSLCNTEARKKEVLDLIEKAPKGKDPGPYALGKYLENHPEQHAEFKKLLAADIKGVLELTGPVMDKAEAKKPR